MRKNRLKGEIIKMMVYPEEPSIWAIPHIPALYDDDGDYGGKKTQKLFKRASNLEAPADSFNKLLKS